jgi:UDP-hydrolysing UDP-N-acetyl-D-glucosamine 2-epimerase
MRSIAVVTVARSDFGIYLPILRLLQEQPDVRMNLIVAGMHLSPEFGLTVGAIEKDGFTVAERIEMLLSSDSPEGMAKSMGLGTLGFAQAFARLKPDLLLTLGDRAEMHAAVVAALPFKIPVAHIHGGESSFGAIDDLLRHSISKLSHLHFVATHEYGRRVLQMGEEPWRITVSGAPALDNLHQMTLLSPAELEERFGLRLDRPTLLVTYHPVTLEFERTEWQIDELLAALVESGLPVVITKPNADTGGRLILHKLDRFAQGRTDCFLVDNLGTQAYFSLMTVAAAMVGNSSSGIIEAPTFKLPVVNVGTRQEGRCRAANVIDVGYSRQEILAGIRQALHPAFRQGLKHLVNPFGSGHAAEVIVERLRTVPLDDRLLRKRFHDLDATLLRLSA